MIEPLSRLGAFLHAGLTRIVWFGVVVTFAIAVFGLLAGFAPSLDAFSHFRPFLAAGTAVLLVLCLIVRSEGRRLMLGATVVALFLHAFPVATEARFALDESEGAAPAPADAQRLRFMTFNMWGGNRKGSAIVDFVRRETPDIVVLQEAFKEQEDLVDRLRPELPYRADCIGKPACNLVVLSRYPIVESRVYLRDWDDRNPWTVPVVVAKIATGSDAATPDNAVTVVATHLSWPLPADHQQRQFRQLSDVVNGLNSDNVILAGDFNSTPWSTAFADFEKTLSLTRVTRFMPTWPSERIGRLFFGVSFLPIDHVFVGAAFTKSNIWRGPSLGSDHHPVIVVLERLKDDT